MAPANSHDPATTPTTRPSFAERDAETTELFSRLTGASEHEANRLVEQIAVLYLDLCSRMAARYDGRGIEHDDLVQVARLALVKAIRGYQPDHAPSFAAYAVPTISGELKRWFRDRGWAVRPPRRLQELRAEVSATRATLEQQTGGTASDVDVADAIGVSVDEIREVASAAKGFSTVSLDCSPVDDEQPALAALLARDDSALQSADDRVCLTEALVELDEKERDILLLRYVEGLTQREIGEARGISQMQVSRTLRRITTQLHDQLVKDQVDPPLTHAS